MSPPSHPPERLLRVFVNGDGVDVPRGATALDAVREWNAAAAEAVRAGAQIITDSRGLPASADGLVQAGSIFRVLPARAARAAGG
ncbi:MAG TPA: hypothetical protein VJU87_05330, partial [Gemmatimonadaceae bacterium]|nr:hypothetical protein [Gemmatimonadaceae bacterium]